MKAKILFILIWFIAVASSFHFLMKYSAAEGRTGVINKDWPESTQLKFKNPYELVVFIHPGCSCSKASLVELSRLVSQESEIASQIVFMKTAKLSSLLEGNDLLAQARRIPRATIIFDEDGKEAKIFGALTSGHTFLYHEERGLLFSGGITAARGHEGKSVGQESIQHLLKNKPARNIASVFGCDIFGTLFKTGNK